MTDNTSQTRQLMTDDGPMDLIVATPVESPKGGVLVVQEAFGLTGHIRRVCEALAHAGYLAVAPAFFHRSEDQIFGYDEYDKLIPTIMTLTLEGIHADVDAGIAELERNHITRAHMGIVGFCMGGSVALETASRLELGAAVSYYGGGIAQGRFGLEAGLVYGAALRTPWMGLYGDLDQGIPVDDVEQLRAVVAGASVPTEVVRYAEADHGFHCDERASFHPASSSDAWARTISFFDTHLV